MSRMYDHNRLIGLPILELEFEKDVLDPNIIIGGENILLRKKKEKPTLCKRCFQVGHSIKFCRSNREIRRDCTRLL